MAGTPGGASMADGSCDSEIVIKRLKSDDEQEEDRLSTLPDFLIHRILSFIPATDLVKTQVLSKCWMHQWTHVPVLKFVPLYGMSANKFYNLIEKTLSLHNCPNIDKFVVNLKSLRTDDYPPDLNSWIQFALGRNVKKLTVNFNEDHHVLLFKLPQFLFNNSSLVQLKLYTCNFVLIENVNWGSLKILRLYLCDVQDGKIEKVVSGSPLLEYLELVDCNRYSTLDIASKSLKTLILDGVSCFCEKEIRISCPNLERLRISGLVWFISLELINLPSSVYATFDFYFDEFLDLEAEDDTSVDDCINLVKQILGQVEHVEKLEIGRRLMEVLSSSTGRGECIGYLTDSIVERILFFFPSIKDGFESDLYNMWQCTWKDDPVFDFVSNEKFVVHSKDIPLMFLDPRLSLWILFAVRNYVKELILDCDATSVHLRQAYILPQFLFNNYSFVKMKICASEFIPRGKVNWQSLKSLELEHCWLGDKAIANVLSGSPLLECLELRSCAFRETMLIVSEHLKTFLIDEFGKECPALVISCLNLESLRIRGNVSSIRFKLVNLPSTLHATLDLYVLESDNISPDDRVNLVEEIREQILHVEQLNIRFEEVMSKNPSNCSRIR